MSTICLINPTVRAARAERRGIARAFERMCTMVNERGRLVIETFNHLLGLIKSPRMTGLQKQAKFEWVLAGFTAQAEAMG